MKSAQNEEHIVGGGKIRSIILGLNDGLISTFTLLVGVAAATLSTSGNTIVILTGIAAMVSGSISMGLGEFISSKSEFNFIQNEIKKEKAEIELFPAEEMEEVEELLREMGLEGETLNSAVDGITADKDKWLQFLVGSELGLDEPESPVLGALLTFLFFIVGTLIPLSPYFLDLDIVSLILSSVFSFTMLFLVGMAKTVITGENKIKSGLEMVLIGVIAFLVSYSVGLYLEP